MTTKREVVQGLWPLRCVAIKAEIIFTAASLNQGSVEQVIAFLLFSNLLCLLFSLFICFENVKLSINENEEHRSHLK